MPFLETLQEELGPGGVLSGDELQGRSAGVWRDDALCALAMARPRSTAEVAATLSLCHAARIEVVTQGGLTGLVHGADAGRQQLILSLERMREIEQIDSLQRTATVQAGVTLQALQEAVQEQGLAFPLDLGARGTATLGGNAATNAGGNRVIRYGMMRDMVLGMEVVLADGTVISSMNTLLKNNTGYDLKQLFIGSEGTLGVITRLVLRLRETPGSENLALLAVDSFEAVTALLKALDRGLGGGLSAFEVLWNSFYRLVTEPPAHSSAPLASDHPYYILVEAQGSDEAADSERFQRVMEQVFEAQLVADAVIAQSGAERDRLWAIRDDVEQTFRYGTPVVFDVSLPIAAMQDYVATLQSGLDRALPDNRLWIFGHLGDGNLHIIVQSADGQAASHREVIEALVYEPLAAVGGSVSAEHGIGLEKKPYLSLCRSDDEIALMRSLKTTLDPRAILNPGKIIDPLH